jgi:4-hydroxybenzoate polyprenyltransferase
MKKILLVLKNEFVFGGHLLSLGASSIVLTGLMIFNLTISWELLVVAYLGMQIIYSYNHFKEIDHDLISNPERSTFVLGKKKISKILLALNISILSIVLFFTKPIFFVYIITLLFVGILYTDYFKILTERVIVSFKNIYTALCWSFISFAIALFYSIPFHIYFFSFAFFIFIRWLINTAYFDIKDVNSDRDRNIKTLPVFFGIKKTVNYLHVLNFLSLIVLILFIQTSLLPKSAVGLGFTFIFSWIYLKITNKLSRKEIRELS